MAVKMKGTTTAATRSAPIPTVKIRKFGRGELDPAKLHLTSYRIPIDVARKIHAIAQKEGCSMNDVMIAAAVHLANDYGPTRGYHSDLQPSSHARTNYGKGKMEAANDEPDVEPEDEGEQAVEPPHKVTVGIKSSVSIPKVAVKGTAIMVKR